MLKLSLRFITFLYRNPKYGFFQIRKAELVFVELIPRVKSWACRPGAGLKRAPHWTRSKFRFPVSSLRSRCSVGDKISASRLLGCSPEGPSTSSREIRNHHKIFWACFFCVFFCPPTPTLCPSTQQLPYPCQVFLLLRPWWTGSKQIKPLY